MVKPAVAREMMRLRVECVSDSEEEYQSESSEQSLRITDLFAAVLQQIRERPQVDGVQLKDVYIRNQRRFELKWFPLDVDERDYIEKVLRANTLMFKATGQVRRVVRALNLDKGAPSCAALEVRLRGLDTAVEAMHRLKWYTARQIWLDHIQPIKSELKKLNMKYDSLKEQFSTARTEYLQEVSTLRNNTRTRMNPEAWIPQAADIRYFYDPTLSLTDGELSFVAKVITEKLKMIFESSANASCDAAQVSALMAKEESNRMKQLKETLLEKDDEIKDLKEQMKTLEADLAAQKSQPPPPPKTGEQPGAANMVKVLEDQLEDVRAGAKVTQNELQHLSAEHEELQVLFEDESSKRIDAEEDLSKATIRITELEVNLGCQKDAQEALERRLQTLEQEKNELDKQVSRQQKMLKSLSGKSEATTGRRASTMRRGSMVGIEPPMVVARIDKEADGDFGLSVSSAKISAQTPRRASITTGRRTSRVSVPEEEDKDEDQDIVALTLETEQTNRRLSIENAQLQNNVDEMLERMSSYRQQEAKRAADSAMTDALQLKRITSRFTDNQDNDEEDAEAIDEDWEPKGNIEKMHRLRREAQRTAELLEQKLKDCTDSHLEAAQNETPDSHAERIEIIGELHRRARVLEIEMFSGAILLEAYKLGVKPGSGLMKTITGHCNHLRRKLEASAAANSGLISSLMKMQMQTSAAAQAVSKAAASGTAEELQRGLKQLHAIADHDAMCKALDDAMTKKELPVAVQKSVDRLYNTDNSRRNALKSQIAAQEAEKMAKKFKLQDDEDVYEHDDLLDLPPVHHQKGLMRKTLHTSPMGAMMGAQATSRRQSREEASRRQSQQEAPHQTHPPHQNGTQPQHEAAPHKTPSRKTRLAPVERGKFLTSPPAPGRNNSISSGIGGPDSVRDELPAVDLPATSLMGKAASGKPRA